MVLTNPDMIHRPAAPSSQWAEFLADLRYVVMDELHTYRGVFGSHVANVLRRLRRICRASMAPARTFFVPQPRWPIPRSWPNG